MNVKLVVVGSSNTDMVTKSDRLPKPGETVIAHDFFIGQGGKGANQAVAAARMGATVTFIARVGDDDFGRNAVKSYKKDGIDTSFITFDPDQPTGTALINLDDQGQNMIVATMGANRNLTQRHIDRAEDALNSCSAILTQLELSVTTVLHLARRAKKSGKIFILNPAPIQEISEELISLTDYIIPNQTEAEMLTSVKVDDLKSAENAAGILIRRGAKNVVITMGAKGAFIKDRFCSKIIPAPVVQAVDTVGAGDTFCGTFAVEIIKGKSLEQAVELANKSAALAVTRSGAQAGIPFRRELILK